VDFYAYLRNLGMAKADISRLMAAEMRFLRSIEGKTKKRIRNVNI
jgi:hypothetical protein